MRAGRQTVTQQVRGFQILWLLVWVRTKACSRMASRYALLHLLYCIDLGFEWKPGALFTSERKAPGKSVLVSAQKFNRRANSICRGSRAPVTAPKSPDPYPVLTVVKLG